MSLKTNTTSLERDLGELLAQLSAHSGPLSETGGTIAAVMEIAIEGPQCEEHFLVPAPRKVVLSNKPNSVVFVRPCGWSILDEDSVAHMMWVPRPKVASPKSMVHSPRSTSQALLLLQLLVGPIQPQGLQKHRQTV